MTRPGFTRLDALLILVVIAWGANLSVVKVALHEFPAVSFNALRLIIAALSFLALVAWRTEPGVKRIERDDWPRVLFLGAVGGALYQFFFMYGVPRTSVANAGLIFGLSPVVISLMSAAVGHEQLPWTRWAGGVLSLLGLYFVVGVGGGASASALVGDALVFVAMLCWAVFSVASRPLLGRYSPTVLTAWATVVGTAIYLPFSIPTLVSTNWTSISSWSWALIIGSSVVCLVIAYAIWYTGVQRIGSTRTSAYSNLVPIAAMVVGWLWLGEPLTAAQGMGAAAILAGVFLTRLSPVVLTPLRTA